MSWEEHRGGQRLDSRPFEPLGLTTLMWQAVPPLRVPLNRLVPTQDVIEEALDDPDTSASGDPFPHVVQHHDRLYITDGHHRVARARRRGQAFVVARVLLTYK